MSLRGVRIALIGCAPYGWSQSLLDIARHRAPRPEAARGADVVIVYMHAGAEGSEADARRGCGRDVSRRAAREQPSVRARDDPRRRRSRLRLRTARAARYRVVPQQADRLQPREPRRHAHTQHRRLARVERPSTRDARRPRQLPRRVRRTPTPRRRRYAGAEAQGQTSPRASVRFRTPTSAHGRSASPRAGRLAAPGHTHLWSTSFSR